MGIRKLELLVLRPLFTLLLVAAVILLVKGMWFLFGVFVLGIFYLGSIGSKLHPLQSASDLSRGPTAIKASRLEEILLSPDEQNFLVGHACTRAGILVGTVAGMILWKWIGWRWYLAAPVAWTIFLFFGVILKVSFSIKQKTE